MAIILFDIGGTKTRVGISADGEKIDAVKIGPTPKDFNAGMKLLKRLADEISNGAVIEKVGGGIAGMLNRDRRSLYRSPNLPGWASEPLGEEIGRAFGAPVVIENDAALAGLGEALMGAGKGYRSVMYMTISTGVGGARILNGKIDERAFSFEPGQQLMSIGQGMKLETLENLISGAAIEQRFGKVASEIKKEDKIWDEIADRLAYGIYNSVLHWSPDIVVLGGFLILDDLIPLEKVERKLKEILNFFPETPAITKAALADKSGLCGALCKAKGA